MDLTQEEKDFLKNILSQISVKPSSPEAAKTVEMVQSILRKI